MFRENIRKHEKLHVFRNLLSNLDCCCTALTRSVSGFLSCYLWWSTHLYIFVGNQFKVFLNTLLNSITINFLIQKNILITKLQIRFVKKFYTFSNPLFFGILYLWIGITPFGRNTIAFIFRFMSVLSWVQWRIITYDQQLFLVYLFIRFSRKGKHRCQKNN